MTKFVTSQMESACVAKDMVGHVVINVYQDSTTTLIVSHVTVQVQEALQLFAMLTENVHA